MPAQKAIVRQISRSLAACELLYVPRTHFDLALAQQQHAAYIHALQSAGLSVEIVPEEPDLPDATFVEDTAIILDELAILCRLGNKSRSPEPERIAPHLQSSRTLFNIRAPGTLEGGDVLRIGKKLYVGLSTRTNPEGIRQLAEIVSPYGYKIIPVDVKGCLHLKTAITAPTENLLFANPAWIDTTPFTNLKIINVPPAEPWAANTLPVNKKVLIAASAPRAAELLSRQGLSVEALDISQLQKAEAGLTCLSLIFA
jgi:dimethylargininase